jgi:hypothetical protein
LTPLGKTLNYVNNFFKIIWLHDVHTWSLKLWTHNQHSTT